MTCESTLDSPLEAQTSIGPTEQQVVCEIGGRLDINHFVSLTSRRNFPIDVTSFTRILSAPRHVRFAESDQAKIKLSDDSWTAICVLDTDESKTFGVRLLPIGSGSSEQDIEVRLVVDRWHDVHNYELVFPPLTVLS